MGIVIILVYMLELFGVIVIVLLNIVLDVPIAVVLGVVGTCVLVGVVGS